MSTRRHGASPSLRQAAYREAVNAARRRFGARYHRDAGSGARRLARAGADQEQGAASGSRPHRQRPVRQGAQGPGADFRVHRSAEAASLQRRHPCRRYLGRDRRAAACRRRPACSASFRNRSSTAPISIAARRCRSCSASPGRASRCTRARISAIRRRTAASACRGEFAARLYKFTRLGARVIVARGELKPVDFADPHLFVHKDMQAAALPPPRRPPWRLPCGIGRGADRANHRQQQSQRCQPADAAMPAKPADLGLRGSSPNVAASFVLASDDAKPGAGDAKA